MAAGETLRTVPVVATAAAGDDTVVVLGPTDIAAAAATTTTTVRPTTTTVVRRVYAKKVLPRSQPRPVVRPKAAPATVPERSQSGKASWYDHRAGICAHRTLPFGTVVNVTNVANGRSVLCTVGDRGPYVDGWVIDLNPREFQQLASTSAGVIAVRLNW